MRTLSQERNGGIGGGGRVRVRDLLRRDGLVLDSPNDRMSMEDTLIAGDLLHQELRHGLVLHGCNVIEEQAFTATSSLREGLSCIFFLNGKVDTPPGCSRIIWRTIAGTRHSTSRNSFAGSSRRPLSCRGCATSIWRGAPSRSSPKRSAP